MLIRTLEIQIDRPGDLRSCRRDAFERKTRVGPNIHHVVDLVVVGRFGTDQLFRREREPRLDTTLLHAISHLIDQLERTRMQLACDFVDEERNRHTPGSLARDAPVGAVFDHARDSLFAPSRRPGDLFDVLERVCPKALLIHADEPLRRRPENHRSLVTPAMRIAVLEWHVLHEAATLAHEGNECSSAFIDFLPFDDRRAWQEATIATDRILDGQAVALTHGEVFLAVRGCRVYGTGAGIERDVFSQDHRNLLVEERMPQQ